MSFLEQKFKEYSDSKTLCSDFCYIFPSCPEAEASLLKGTVQENDSIRVKSFSFSCKLPPPPPSIIRRARGGDCSVRHDDTSGHFTSTIKPPFLHI